MESTLRQHPAPAAACNVDLVTAAHDCIQEVEPAAALPKEALKAAARAYTARD